MKLNRLLVAAVTAACLATAAAPALAVEAVPDINALQYQPIGHFKPGDPLPPANAYQADTPTGEFLRQEMADGIFNPSGTFNAFDTNIFEVLAIPYRAAGDEHADDPYGNGQDGGAAQHGRCSGDPRSDRPRGGGGGFPAITGECFNHQLEYIEYYERTMMSILGKFGAFTKRYEFHNPSDPSSDMFQPPLLANNTMGGRAMNPAVIVPGTDESDESIVIGAHFDKTNDGPAAAWDSQEGHAQMIRVAKLMADYWDAKDARPTATVKFIPWDAEESGTLGSQDYAANVIPPGDEEFKVRGYWNTDPCAGGYPAFRFANRANRTQLGIQLANPLRGDDPVTSAAGLADPNLDPKYHARINSFNDAAPTLVEQVFDHLDDELASQPPDTPQIFVSTAEGPSNPPFGGDIGTTDNTKPVVIGKARPFLFGSDWLNFEARGIPFFNPGPEITGPSSFGDPGNPDALVILHSPNDNLDMMNRYAGAPQGQIAEGWVKGMEMCAHLLAWGMLQPGQGGASLEEVGKLTAYYEALPNEAGVNEPVHFDASGSHVQTAAGTTSEGLTYAWEFGDGTTGTGKDPYHRYAAEGTYQSKLTVTNTANGDTATMEIPIVIQAVPAVALPIPSLEAPETDEDGTFELDYSIRDTPSTLSGWQILEAADYRRLFADDMEGPVDTKWTASEPTNPDIAPWQESDSGTRKVRGNAFASGAQSYWTGIPADKLKPADAQNGESILTFKEPLQVPPEAGAEFKYKSLFINESNDRGYVQIAEAREGDLSWETIDIVGGANDVCSPADTKTINGDLTERGADLSNWAGKKILVRFVYTSADTNLAASQPCGWYIDDVEIAIGTFKPIDRTNQFTDVGQFFEGAYTVRGRQKGVYAYRVQGLYPPNGEYEGQASNIRVVDVTTGANPPAPPGGAPPRTDPPAPPGPQVCPFAPKFRSVKAQRRGRGLRFDFSTLTGQPARIDVFQASRGTRVFRAKRVARFAGRTRSFAWNGRSRRRLTNGFYFARFMTGNAEDHDIRRVTLQRSKGRFRIVRPHYRRSTCGVLRSFKLSSPAFGGRNKKRLGVAYRLGAEARVSVVVRRGKKVVRRFRARNRSAAVIHRLSIRPRGLRRGVYRVTVTVAAAGRTTRSTLYSRRL
ncbi:MAG TPA: M28 family peptidase [Actinomycetota bacterium]|nr:M28 family peptidase [Actinomycetota bacterium]